ncbi:MAG: DUF2325 domain-containing protein [Dehalococcoidia bacterium]
MIRLRADEHRYLVTANGRDEALVRQIPGCRYVASSQALQLPRQPGVILALDRAFGEQGWEHPADLDQEIVEVRTKQTPAAQQRAVVSLVGNEFAVECTFGDKELVKLVPGYRWSAPQRKWFLPACPMALDLLQEHFGALVEVDEAARKLVELKRIDEAEALSRAKLTLEAREDKTDAFAAPRHEAPEPEPGDVRGEAPNALLERLDRLASAVEELVGLLRAGGQIGPAPAAVGAPEERLETIERPEPVAGAWRDVIAEAANDPSEALQRINSRLQLARAEDLPVLRATAGIASSMAGDHQGALSYFKKAQEHAGVAFDTELEQRIGASYVESVLALISGATAPERPVESLGGLEELVLAELVQNSGFNDAGLGSKEARDVLSLLMDDHFLRRRQPILADYCRVLHLVCVARGGRWMAAERVVDMLRHGDLTDDGFALGAIVLANTVFEQPCLVEWMMRWPPETSEVGFDDLRRITADAGLRLAQVDATLGAQAALSVLALISGAPIEVASMEERRALVRLIPPRAGERRYAEFLAAFQLAQSGTRKVTQNFPGYLQVLGNVPLAQSAPHLLTVFVNDSGGPDSTTRRIAEEVYLETLRSRGVRDPMAEVIELVDMLAESPKVDNLLNEICRGIEELDFPGAKSFSREQRADLFERAFSLALKAGHDHDTVAAFDRLTRELLTHGDFERLRTLCMGVPPGFKPLQLPVGQALLSLQLERDEDFEATAEAVLRNCNPKDPGDEGTHELKGLALAFPKFREFLLGRLDDESEGAEAPEASFEGMRLVVVGGHQWLKKHAMPQFDAWGIKTTWLDPDDAKNGPQATSLASGESDLIVINTACISHAASGRVKAEANKDASKTRVVFHNSRGLGALLSITREALADSGPLLEASRPTKAAGRRKLLR